MSPITGYHHVSFTVTDLDASARWYEELLALKYVMTEQHEGGHARVYVHPESGLFFGLHAHDRNGGQSFHESATGMDHACFSVASRDELEEWAKRLDERNVERSPIADTEYGSLIVFRDPDNIQLELFAPPGS